MNLNAPRLFTSSTTSSILQSPVSEWKAAVASHGRLEDFELGSLLGRGSYACVYEARSRHTGQRVALKVAQPPPLAGTIGPPSSVPLPCSTFPRAPARTCTRARLRPLFRARMRARAQVMDKRLIESDRVDRFFIIASCSIIIKQMNVTSNAHMLSCCVQRNQPLMYIVVMVANLAVSQLGREALSVIQSRCRVCIN